MRRYSFAAASLALIVELSACSGGGGSPAPGPTTPPIPPVVTQSYTFPSGDAKATVGTAWDIIGIKTTLTGSGMNTLPNSYDHLKVDVTFVQDVSNALPTPGTTAAPDGSQLGVSLAIDSDGNPATGNSGVCNPPVAALTPFEYTTEPGINQPRLSDGNYSILLSGTPVYSGPPNPDAEAATSLSGHTISFTFNLNTLGVFAGAKAPKIGIAAAAANSNSGFTDCVPTGLNSIYEVFTTTN